jgi:hypothetical protein
MPFPIDDLERERFVRYCEQQAADHKAIIEQLQKINAPKALIDQRQITSAAYLIVAADMRRAEAETLFGSDNG